MPAIRALILSTVLSMLVACGGGSGDGGVEIVLPATCPTQFLTTSPVAMADIDYIIPLGDLNPSGHVFPSDRIYLVLRSLPGAGGAVETTLEFAHVSSLDPSLFGDTSTLDGFTFQSEYSTGGDTFRTWRRVYGIAVTAGAVLGTTGGTPGVAALDFVAHDTRVTLPGAANPSRWRQYLNTICALDLYVAGAVKTQLMSMLDRAPTPGDTHPCGWLMQDVAGTAQGVWFRNGTTQTYPEDPHIALVWDARVPSTALFSVGTSVTTLPTGEYRFTPLGAGRFNRRFENVTPGQTYGYQTTGGPTGTTIVRLPDANTLWLEHLPAATTDPATWIFTGGQTVFERYYTTSPSRSRSTSR